MQNRPFFADFLLKSAYLGSLKMTLQLKIIIPFSNNILATFHGKLTSGFYYEHIHNILHGSSRKTEKSGSSIFCSVKFIFKSRIFLGNEFVSKS